MKKPPYHLQIFLFTIVIDIPFWNLLSMYLFVFDLKPRNHTIDFLLWDHSSGLVIDFFHRSYASE